MWLFVKPQHPTSNKILHFPEQTISEHNECLAEVSVSYFREKPQVKMCDRWNTCRLLVTDIIAHFVRKLQTSSISLMPILRSHDISTDCGIYCPASRTTLVARRFRVAAICPIIQVPHCIRVFFYFVWFVFINHIFQFYYELCTYCNILDIYLS